MNSIGLKNFRCFKDLPELEFGKINLLIGKNNSGKSTMIRAYRCLLDNIKNMKVGRENASFSIITESKFHFDTVENLHLGLFDDVLSKGSNSKEISLSGKFPSNGNLYRMEIDIIPDVENSNKAIMRKIAIAGNGIQLIFEPDKCSDTWGMVHLYKDEKSIGSVSLKEDHVYYVRPYVIEHLLSNLKLSNLTDKEREIFESVAGDLESISKTIENYCKESDVLNIKSDFLIHYETIAPLYKKIRDCAKSQRIIEENQLNVLEGTLLYINKIIEDFQQSKIKKHDIEYEYIIRMMRLFEIGSDFKIKTNTEGLLYLCIVDDNEEIPLMYKGTGNIRLMAMIFILAMFVKEQKDKAFPIVVIEEPEQNLHPMTQSLIADFLIETSKLLPQAKFFVETHSEYLVRRTQVLAKMYCVGGGRIDDFSYKTFYFPSKGDSKTVPYDMKYRSDGRFEKKFGSGFFDESSLLALQLL